MEFKVISQDSGVDAESDRDPRSRIDKMVSENKVFLFMKGTPDSPQCGFSYKVVDILKDISVIDKPADMQGTRLSIVLSPK